MADDNEILYAMMNGISFSGAKLKKETDEERVRTKARGKQYHTGAHGSGAARHKAEIRQRVKNRQSQRKNRDK
jgi:hypothetical protein